MHARSDCRCETRSALYRNPPMGPPDQPHYVNAVAAVRTALPAEALLDVLQSLEQAAGRVRSAGRWQARTLDLDLLVLGTRRVNSPRLTLPHPGAHERAFVIHPLAEIAPELEIPGRGIAAALAASVDDSALERIAPGRSWGAQR